MKNTVILGGFARLPKGLFSEETFQVIVELDSQNQEILDFSCIPHSRLIDQLLRDLLVGEVFNLDWNMNKILGEIENDLHLKAKKAIVAAVRDLGRVYLEYRGDQN